MSKKAVKIATIDMIVLFIIPLLLIFYTLIGIGILHQNFLLIFKLFHKIGFVKNNFLSEIHKSDFYLLIMDLWFCCRVRYFKILSSSGS